jgi:hypothetical protein
MSKYDPKYCKQLIDFFTVKETYTFETKTRSYYPPKDGKPAELKTEHKEMVAAPLPFFEDFAFKIGVDRTTLNAWAKTHPEFGAAYQRARELRAKLLINGGLRGLYDAKYAQLVSINFDEVGFKNEVDHNVKVDPITLINIWEKREKSLKRKDNEPTTDADCK